MEQKSGLLLLAFIIVSLAGCGGGGSHEPAAQGPSPEAQFMVLSGLPVGSLAAKQTTIISSQADYQTYWAARLGSSATLPTVDFGQGQVLIADMGIRSSTGNYIGVTSVSVSDSYVVANIKLTEPSFIAGAALTAPAQVVYIPSRKEILISEQVEFR